ncbi:MAG: hypothetical protein EBZ07_07370, partial [Verrucomicrobia bacterium]|nr:hypothetical protein [Verrucomicrobiota bacterium]
MVNSGQSAEFFQTRVAGYLGKEASMADALAGGPLVTGDLSALIASGAYDGSSIAKALGDSLASGTTKSLADFSVEQQKFVDSQADLKKAFD